MIWSLITQTFQEPSSRYFKRFHDILAMIILVSTLLVVSETVPFIANRYGIILEYIDIFVVVFFSIEYLLRFFTDKKPLRYVFSTLGIIDLLAIIPSLLIFILPAFSSAIQLLRVIRSVRILRLLRVIRLIRFFGGNQQGKDRVDQAEELLPLANIEIYFFALFIIITFSASLMYLAESHVPGSVFRTIPDGMWWAITTVTTVGYGDMVPITTAGKIIASGTMLSGFALLALLLSVIGPALQVLLFGRNLNTVSQNQKASVTKTRKPRTKKTD